MELQAHFLVSEVLDVVEDVDESEPDDFDSLLEEVSFFVPFEGDAAFPLPLA